jgi:hypothetical protein
MKFMSFEASEFSVADPSNERGIPAAQHLLRGEAISWLHALTYLDALVMVEEDLKLSQGTRKSLYGKYENFLQELVPQMPPPIKCQVLHCERLPACHTSYAPHYFHRKSLDHLVIPGTNWTYKDEPPIEKFKSAGYIYRKSGYYHTSNIQGELQVKISVGQVPDVWLCGAIPKSLRDAEFFLDVDVLIYDSIVYEPSENRINWKKFKFGKTMNCLALYDLPKGEHVLSISAKKDTPNAELSVTHVIFWPRQD